MNTRLKELRKNILKLTLKEFGKEISLSAGGLGDIESGRTPLQERHIKLISQAFNVNEEWLRNGTEPIFKEQSENPLEDFFDEKNASELERKIIKKYFNLNENHRKMFENFLQECIKELLKDEKNKEIEEDDNTLFTSKDYTEYKSELVELLTKPKVEKTNNKVITLKNDEKAIIGTTFEDDLLSLKQSNNELKNKKFNI